MPTEPQDHFTRVQHQAYQVLAGMSLSTPREDIEILEAAIKMRLRDLDEQAWSTKRAATLKLVR